MDLAALIDVIGVEHVGVVGFSFAGGVALELALTRDHRMAFLGLLAPVLPDRPFEDEFKDNLRQVARTIRSEGIAAAMAGPWLSSPLFAHAFTKPGIRAMVADIVKDFPGAEFLAAERDLVDREWKLPDRLSDIGIPTRVMVGEQEMPGFRAFADEATQRIPGATLEVVPGCGHLLPLEAPKAVAEMVVDLCTAS
jgi:pimeloyl-ACP methyl ester carboxylesterase